ncbi:MAG: HPr family phosphocarrier protein [Lachnospiraceae bacterium]|nr:HPr family phosphocarrier protein [Lachnospiraceae bacterium]
MVKGLVKVNCPAGLHMRPVGTLCKQAMVYDSRVEFNYKASFYNVKSVLSVLGACICADEEVELVCTGPDEQKAFDELKDLIENHLEG